MKLTEKQKQEIRNYIINVPKFRETYNELYDHIINSLEDCGEVFSINEVIVIINRDFGGFSEIVNQEKNYQIELSKQYNRAFRMEMVNTFKWPSIFNNLSVLALCLIIYFNNDGTPFNTRPILLASIFWCILIALFGFSKIFIKKYKHTKYSILDNYLGYSCSFGFIVLNAFLLIFLGKEGVFEVGDDAKLIITLSLFFFTSVYIRAFMKFYNQKIRIFAH